MSKTFEEQVKILQKSLNINYLCENAIKFEEEIDKEFDIIFY